MPRSCSAAPVSKRRKTSNATLDDWHLDKEAAMVHIETFFPSDVGGGALVDYVLALPPGIRNDFDIWVAALGACNFGVDLAGCSEGLMGWSVASEIPWVKRLYDALPEALYDSVPNCAFAQVVIRETDGSCVYFRPLSKDNYFARCVCENKHCFIAWLESAGSTVAVAWREDAFFEDHLDKDICKHPEVFDAMMRWEESTEDRSGFIFDVMDKSCFSKKERMRQALFASLWNDDSEEEFECACQNIATVLREGFPHFYYNSAFVVSCMKEWGICHDEEKAIFAKNFPRFMRYDLTVRLTVRLHRQTLF